jgi:hypothetical protein
VPFFGAATVFVVNITPDKAVRYSLTGEAEQVLPRAFRRGHLYVLLNGRPLEVSISATWHTSKINSIEDLKAREMTVGGTGPSTDTEYYPKLMNALLGTKFRVISGYPGGIESSLAMELEEVAGQCGWAWSSVAPTKPRLAQGWQDQDTGTTRPQEVC